MLLVAAASGKLADAVLSILVRNDHPPPRAIVSRWSASRKAIHLDVVVNPWNGRGIWREHRSKHAGRYVGISAIPRGKVRRASGPVERCPLWGKFPESTSRPSGVYEAQAAHTYDAICIPGVLPAKRNSSPCMALGPTRPIMLHSSDRRHRPQLIPLRKQ